MHLRIGLLKTENRKRICSQLISDEFIRISKFQNFELQTSISIVEFSRIWFTYTNSMEFDLSEAKFNKKSTLTLVVAFKSECVFLKINFRLLKVFLSPKPSFFDILRLNYAEIRPNFVTFYFMGQIWQTNFVKFEFRDQNWQRIWILKSTMLLEFRIFYRWFWNSSDLIVKCRLKCT